MDNSQKIIERIKEYKNLRYETEIADLLDVPKATVYAWLRRDNISKTKIDLWCAKHNLNVDYFLYGEGIPEAPGSFNAPKEKGLIPVIGLAEAGPGIFSEDAFPAGVSDTYLSKPNGLKDNNAFGVRIEGDSMSPAFKSGQMVIVSPNLECQEGDVVVANLKNNGNILGELKYTPTKIKFKKYNPSVSDIVVAKDELIWCYPVVWHKRR